MFTMLRYGIAASRAALCRHREQTISPSQWETPHFGALAPTPLSWIVVEPSRPLSLAANYLQEIFQQFTELFKNDFSFRAQTFTHFGQHEEKAG